MINQLARARTNKEYKLERIVSLVAQVNEYSKMFKLGFKDYSIEGLNLENVKERLKIEMTITRDDGIDQIRDGTTTIIIQIDKDKTKKKNGK